MKKCITALLLTILLTLSSISNAQVAEDKTFEYRDFSSLLQSALNPYVVSDKGAVEARNLRSNIKVSSLSKRSPMLLYGSAGSFSINGIHRYYKSDDTKFLVIAGSTFLKVGNDDTGVFTTLRDQLTEGRRWQFVTYKDTMIAVNGIDANQKWDGTTSNTDDTDGHRTANLLTADLGSAYAELNTGANLDASSWYQYRIVYYDGTTYFYSTARSNPILTGATVRDVTLTDIPIGPSGTTQRLIYRTEGNASRSAVEADTSFYRVVTISDNTTTTYNDAVTDATLLGDSAPTWATVSAGTDVTPPVAKFIEIHNERIWLANNPSAKSNIYFSDSFLQDYFKSGTNFDQIRPDDGDQITFIKNLLGLLIVGKTNTIQKFLTDNTDTTKWRITDPFSFVGCPAPYTVRNSPLGIIYLGRDGLYIFNGERSQLISDVVTPNIKDISQSNIDDTSAVFFDNEYQLSYTSDSQGAGTNDTVLLLDTTRNAYVVDDKSLNSFEVLDSGSDFGTIYAGSSGQDGNVFIFSTNPSEWIHRYKSDLVAGTKDTVVIGGTENEPTMEIGWGVSIDTSTLSGVTIDSATYSTAIIDRPQTTGEWFSPIFNINASSLEKLEWNEDLGAEGDVTFAIRVASTSGGISSATFSSEFTNPSGSDISGVTAGDFIQIRASLSTTDITLTPQLFQSENFVIKLTYEKEGSAGESSVLALWKSGWNNFGVPFHPKRIKEIKIFYEGDTGTITFGLKNSDGDIDTSFNIDLTVLPDDDVDDQYTGNDMEKIFTWFPPLNSEASPTPIGEYWQFLITEDSTNTWKIHRIKIRYDVEELYES